MDNIFEISINNMKNAIDSLNEKDKNYILNYEPCLNRGFLWDEGIEYKRIKDVLSVKTDSDGHSGASFSICLRAAIEQLKEKELIIVQGEEINILNPI